MAVESDADRLVFFDTDEFGTSATINAATVKGIFDNDYYQVEFDGYVSESNQPTFICRTMDISSLAHGDTVTISGTAYVVVEIQPDSFSTTKIILREPT